jgi:carbamoyl-phosphate synthase small subunit
MAGLELASTVTRQRPMRWAGDAQHRVALIDFGIKLNSLRCLLDRDCRVRVFPMTTALE